MILSHPIWGCFLFNQCLHVVHNYTKIKGLHLRKITSLPNLHSSFQSSPKLYRMLITTHLHTVKVTTILIPSFHGLR